MGSKWSSNVIVFKYTISFHHWVTGVCSRHSYPVQNIKKASGSTTIVGSGANLPLLF